MTESRTYICKACSEPATTLTILTAGDQSPLPLPDSLWGALYGESEMLVVQNHGALSFETPLGGHGEAVRAGDPEQIRKVEPGLVTLHCPRCRAFYCEADYQTRDVWEGPYQEERWFTCPEGHERVTFPQS